MGFIIKFKGLVIKKIEKLTHRAGMIAQWSKALPVLLRAKFDSPDSHGSSQQCSSSPRGFETLFWPLKVIDQYKERNVPCPVLCGTSGTCTLRLTVNLLAWPASLLPVPASPQPSSLSQKLLWDL